jgi:KaiC/GvpD/RAD55 family RecA-like ATPase
MVAEFSTGARQHPGFLAMEEQARLHLEDEIYNAVTTSPYPRLELAKIARWNGVSPEVMENTAQSVIQRRTGQDLEQVEFHQVVKAVQRLELEEPDQGMREWKLQGLARRLRRTPRQIMDAYNKALCTQQPVKPLSIKEFRELAARETEWLIQGWIPQGSCVLLHGEGGAGKTLMVYELVESVLSGKPWNGYQTRQGGVLLVQVDEPSQVTAERMDVRGIQDDSPLYILPDWQVEAMARLENYIEETKPALVVIDSLTAINRNCVFSENDTEYARPVLQLTNIADRHGCAVVIIHHSNAEGNSRGTRAIYNSVSEVWGLSAPSFTERLVRVQKTRMGRPPGRYKFEFDDEEFSFNYLGEDSEDGEENANQEERVRLWLSEDAQKGVRFTSLEISEYLNLTRHCARRASYELWSKGLIKRVRPKGERFFLYYSPSPSSDQCDQEGVSPLITSPDFKTPTQQDFQSSDQCDQCDQPFSENSHVKVLKKDGSHGSLGSLDPKPAPNIETSSDQSEGKNAPEVITSPPALITSQHSVTVGDRVVLTGEGVVKAKKIELAMTWTVKKAGSKWVQVINEQLGDRQYPIEWLQVLEPAPYRVFNG